jgi:hypothetical protein
MGICRPFSFINAFCFQVLSVVQDFQIGLVYFYREPSANEHAQASVKASLDKTVFYRPYLVYSRTLGIFNIL